MNLENTLNSKCKSRWVLSAASRPSKRTCFCLKKGILFRINRPFPSSKKSLSQSEAKCEAIDTKMILNYDANITHFHYKGFALSLVLKVGFFWNSEMAYLGFWETAHLPLPLAIILP